MNILFCTLDVIRGKLYHAKLDSLELESKSGYHNSEHFYVFLLSLSSSQNDPSYFSLFTEFILLKASSL